MCKSYREARMKMSRNSIDSLDTLADLVKEVLEEEPSHNDSILSPEDVEEVCSTCQAEAEPRKSIFGYPTRPLYREIAAMCYLWIEKKQCPILDLPKYDLLDEQGYQGTRHTAKKATEPVKMGLFFRSAALSCNHNHPFLRTSRAATLASINPLLEGLVTLWDDWTKEERKYRVRQIFLLLGRRGLLDMLGIRKTVGTIDTWPPPRAVLEDTFKELQNDKSELTVGARALAKHYHRDSSTSWWGSSTGTEKAKNEHALNTMRKILDTSTWINIHTIVGEVTLIEARQENGYGVRWTLDGKSFRGFLEPQMVGGHEVGWKH